MEHTSETIKSGPQIQNDRRVDTVWTLSMLHLDCVRLHESLRLRSVVYLHPDPCFALILLQPFLLRTTRGNWSDPI